MNGLSSAAVEAIQAAIAHPQGPPRPKGTRPSNAKNKGDKNEYVSKQARANKKEQISSVITGATGDVPAGNRAAETVRGRGRRAEGVGGAGGVGEGQRGSRGRASGRERQVGAYKPAAGKVELEVFGRKVASFGQVKGAILLKLLIYFFAVGNEVAGVVCTTVPCCSQGCRRYLRVHLDVIVDVVRSNPQEKGSSFVRP